MRPRSATAATRGSGFGARLREARGQLGWTQTQLGDAVGKHKDAVSQWEREVMGVSWDTLRQLAAVLDVDEYWLRDGEKLPARPSAPEPVPDAVLEQLEKINKQLARLQEVILVIFDETTFAARDDGQGDELVAASRRVKALLAEGLDVEDGAPRTEAETRTRDADGATTGSARVPSSGTRRSASKRGR